MGRSGPLITAKRQLLDCVTLTMVLLSLLFRPGKCCFSTNLCRRRRSCMRSLGVPLELRALEKLTPPPPPPQTCIPWCYSSQPNLHLIALNASHEADKLLNKLRVSKEANKSRLLIASFAHKWDKVRVVLLPSLADTGTGIAASRASTSLQHFSFSSGATFLLQNSSNTFPGERPS